MKTLLFVACLLCAAWLLAPHSARAARTLLEARCENSIGKPVSVLSTLQNGYSIDNTRSFRSLTSLKGNTASNAFVLGLTRAESQIEIDIKGPMLQDPVSGYECIAPRISVSLLYPPIVIYIGSEFKPGTCAYEEILAHEMRHLNTYLEHLPKVERVVRKALQERFNSKPLYAPRGQANALLKREIDTGWMPYMKRELQKVERLQAAIDTPQEYARLSRICKGEVQSLIGPAR